MTKQSPDSTTESFHADALSASLTVRDIHVSLAWYRDVVGFSVDREMVRDGALHAVAVRAGAVQDPDGFAFAISSPIG